MGDPGILRGIGVVEGVLHQAALPTVQMLHPLLTNHDLLDLGFQIESSTQNVVFLRTLDAIYGNKKNGNRPLSI